jgi:ribosomal protein S18 acetylase RimI-like enzyme
MNFQIRSGTASDGTAILALMPRLASFDLPASRNPVDLWQSDAAMLESWMNGEAEQCMVQVAVDDSGTVLGFTLVSLRPEMLSHEPSAHLEALAVDASAEGNGIGKALLVAAENEARTHGAQSITLHVFATNVRARAVYERSGYDGELLRYTKELPN